MHIPYPFFESGKIAEPATRADKNISVLICEKICLSLLPSDTVDSNISAARYASPFKAAYLAKAARLAKAASLAKATSLAKAATLAKAAPPAKAASLAKAAPPAKATPLAKAATLAKTFNLRIISAGTDQPPKIISLKPFQVFFRIYLHPIYLPFCRFPVRAARAEGISPMSVVPSRGHAFRSRR